jgi:hypothetical protein
VPQLRLSDNVTEVNFFGKNKKIKKERKRMKSNRKRIQKELYYFERVKFCLSVCAG